MTQETGPATLHFDGRISAVPWEIPSWAIYLGDMPTTCRSCSAVVLWIESKAKAKRAPINPDGTSHFATCPDAEKWRKAK